MKEVMIFIAIFIIAHALLFQLEEAPKERAEERYNEVYRITQEMRKKIIDLAEENDNFISGYREVIELTGGEDILDDYFHNSTAFGEVLGEFESDLEDIGW